MNKRINMIKQFLINPINNSIVKTKNIKIKRDKGIWLFGAWMGEKFADNSRFLFQYLHNNKEKFEIKKVVWVTRSNEILKLLSSLGYEVYKIGSEESNYYHLISGVHIVCNSIYRDIDSELSCGALKIQLWHGVGIKACGKLNRKNHNVHLHAFLDNYVWPHYAPGQWGKAFFLATSQENTRVGEEDYGYKKDQIIEGVYPRLCLGQSLLQEEKDLICYLINCKKAGNKIVLYLPTFRVGEIEYIEPYNLDNFNAFLNNNKIVWIQKRHFADKQNILDADHSLNVVELNTNFDINVLYDYIDLLITDYSSASSDAIFKGVRTLEYCPDIDNYLNNERNFVSDFDSYHAEKMIVDKDDLLNEIYRRLFIPLTAQEKESYIRTKQFLFGNRTDDVSEMDQLIYKILSLLEK